MDRRQFLGLGGLAILCGSSLTFSKEQNQKKSEKSFAYKTINEVLIREFLRDYLEEITPKSDNFKKLRKEHGKEGVLEKYCSAHELTLELAFNYQNNNVPIEVYDNLGKQLSKKQHKISSKLSRIDYLDKGVSKAFANWGKFKTQNFQRLLRASKEIETSEQKTPLTKEQKEDYIRQIHNIAYTRKEYEKYVTAQNKANDELYSAMKKTLNGIEKFFGGKEIKTIKNITRRAYISPLEKYFEKKK